MTALRRLSSNTVSGFLGAAACAVLTAGTAVAVSTTAVSITNPTTGKRAHVTAQGSLVTSDRDPFTGTYAKVDAHGRQLVGDGVPVTVWTGSNLVPLNSGTTHGLQYLPLPSTGRLAIRSLSVEAEIPAGQHLKAAVVYEERNGTPTRVSIPLVPQGNFEGRDVAVATLVTELYPRAGSTITLHMERNAGADDASVWVWLRGQLT